MEIKRAVYQNQCFKSVSIKDFDSFYFTSNDVLCVILNIVLAFMIIRA